MEAVKEKTKNLVGTAYNNVIFAELNDGCRRLFIWWSTKENIVHIQDQPIDGIDVNSPMEHMTKEQFKELGIRIIVK